MDKPKSTPTKYRKKIRTLTVTAPAGMEHSMPAMGADHLIPLVAVLYADPDAVNEHSSPSRSTPAARSPAIRTSRPAP